MTVSKAQLRWAHTKKGKKALGTKGVKEFEKDAKGKKLPENVKLKKGTINNKGENTMPHNKDKKKAAAKKRNVKPTGALKSKQSSNKKKG